MIKWRGREGKLESKRIQLELQVLCYSIYTILAKTYQPIGYKPEIRR